jgi:hypothetical protein
MYSIQGQRSIKSRVHSCETQMDVDDVHIEHAPTTVLLAETTFTPPIPVSTEQAFQSSFQLTQIV